MKTFLTMTKRNIKMFFKDKAMFFTSLITPIILLVLYTTFLGKVYRNSFMSNMPEGFNIPESIVNGTVSGQLFSSLLAVSCVTVAFCANMLMVTDKVTGARKDFCITPVKRSTLAMSYYVGTLITTLIVSIVGTIACFIYIAISGWYMSVADVFLILLDIIMLTIFGTALSSIINMFLSSQGQISAVGTVVSSGYGFICGAYMPISQFGAVLQNILAFLPGTYGTSLLKNHALRGVYREMSTQGFPPEVIEGIKDSIDCNIYFFNHKVGVGAMYGIMIGSIVLLLGVYVLINYLRKERQY